jgi:murein DD-endopeptidase MepM/ murein hydrolase activator NlpD
LGAEVAEGIERAEARLTSLTADKERLEAEERSDVLFASEPETNAVVRPGPLAHGTLRAVDDEGAQRGEAGQGLLPWRGRLELPVGAMTSFTPARRGGSSGLEFTAPVGSPVRAIAPGRVVFSQTHGVYGRLVIVDHGSDYHSVYAGLGTAHVERGDEVSQRARVGAAGTDPVYFEIRRGPHTLGAMYWLNLYLTRGHAPSSGNRRFTSGRPGATLGEGSGRDMTSRTMTLWGARCTGSRVLPYRLLHTSP